MRLLINHLWREHSQEIVNKSILNCHVKGMHSIMLVDTPEHRIRMFITTPDHELHYNFNYKDPLHSLAYHAHHCNLELQVIKGSILNKTIVPDFSGTMRLNQFEYKSKILHGEGGFVQVGKDLFSEWESQILDMGTGMYMPAHLIHTVAVPKSLSSAWIVFEGKEDDNYRSVCYSTRDLTTVPINDLYQKPTFNEVYDLLKLAGF